MTYPANNGFAQALKAACRCDGQGYRHPVFYVTTGGFDNPFRQNVNAANGTLLQPDGDVERRAVRSTTI